MSAASLLFRAGERPTLADIRALARREDSFCLSFEPATDTPRETGVEERGDTGQGWVELLSSGLTFHLSGLAPHAGEGAPRFANRYGLAADLAERPLEAITLVPGPHLAGGERMFPVVRCLAMLAARLAGLPGVEGVAWHAAEAISAPDFYARGVLAWVEGGPFPGLGLTALEEGADGSLRSRGLALFTGQELYLPADVAQDRADAAKLALRLINWLVEHGKITETFSFTGPSGEPIGLEPVENSAILRVWRGSL
ncbi:hypothetical protein [Aurantiacibacter luteus]|nr:hypothetical protein [Aurantiacibacter luteus]